VTSADIDQDTFTREWRRWHERHERARADPHGFLAITAIHWLSDEPTRFEDVPGAWSSRTDGVRVVLAEDETLDIDGATVQGHHDFGVVDERASVMAGFDDAVVEVARRGGHDIVRPRHPNHALLRDYRGTPTFEPEPRWVADGRFLAFASPRPVPVGSVVEGLEHVYASPGQAEFELLGATHRVTLFGEPGAGYYFLLFNDATSGTSTYGAVRSVKVELPDEEGRVRIDFNRATNLPCAYTDFATCPLAPFENRLSIPIEAGERTPLERRHDESPSSTA
jgi:uncharacterized protein (DUF1684 family)